MQRPATPLVLKPGVAPLTIHRVEWSGVECGAAAHLDGLLPECCEAVQSLGVVHVTKGLPDQFQNDILELL